MSVTMKVEKKIGKIGNKIQLNLISWNGAPAKYDLRSWWTNKNGEERCNNGVTLTSDEAKELLELLKSLKLK